jgi:hypothetical protein
MFLSEAKIKGDYARTDFLFQNREQSFKSSTRFLRAKTISRSEIFQVRSRQAVSAFALKAAKKRPARKRRVFFGFGFPRNP